MEDKEYSVKLDDAKNIWLRSDDSKTMQGKDDGKVVMNQITLQESERMPDTSTIYNIHLRVVLGRVGVMLNDEEEYLYASGSVIYIPAKTKIGLSNQNAAESMVYLVRI